MYPLSEHVMQGDPNFHISPSVYLTAAGGQAVNFHIQIVNPHSEAELGLALPGSAAQYAHTQQLI